MSEAAKLEDMTYQGIQKMIDSNRCESKTEQSETGGKERVYIALESLSEKAQSRYRRRKKAEADRERAERIDKSAPPWYFGIDIGWYMTNYKEEYMKKVALAQAIEKYLEQKAEHHKNVTQFAEDFAIKYLDMSGKNFRRYLKRYDEGFKWAYIAAEQDGKSSYDFYKILALCTPPKKGKHTKLTEELAADIENLWSSELYHQNLQSMQMLYEDFCKAELAKGAEYIPSYQTVRRYCEEIRARNANVKTVLQYGQAGFRHSGMLKRERDLASLKVMQLIQGDAHTFDCWVSYRQPNGTVTAIRPYLVGFIDTRSRCLVGWGICVQPTAEVIKQVLIHMIYKKKDSIIEGVPEAVLIDNGKDFTAQTLTGRNRKQRFDVDGEIKGFYKSIGISYDMRALPYTPWTKGQIERLFGTIIQGFSKRFASYTGTLTGSKTSGKVQKDIKGMLERGELYTLDEFSEMFDVYINDVYHMKNHSGLKKQGEPKPIPIEVYKNAERYIKAAPPFEYALSLLGKSEERTVSNVGIYINNITYSHEELGGYVGEKVIVRYNLNDLESIMVYSTDGRQICRAYTAEKLNPTADKDDAVLTEHLKAQKRQYRKAKELIAEMKIPYAERGLHLPELENAPQKIVSLPQDRQFGEVLEKRAVIAKKNEKKTTVDNDFMKSQAMKAFERIG